MSGNTTASATETPSDAAEASVTQGQLNASNALTRYFVAGLAFVFSGGAGSCGVVSALSLVRSEARAAAAELVAPIDAGRVADAARIATLEQQRQADRKEANERFERIEASSTRQEAKLDALLERMRVPNPAPAPVDGGPR